MPLARLNQADRSEFIGALGDVFEDAPWLADAAVRQRPFATVAELYAAKLAVLAAAPPEIVTQFLNNHPDLTGPAARTGPLTAASAREQAGAKLDDLSDQETARLAQWNAQYRARFGFPFIICALRHSKASIFAELRAASPPIRLRRDALFSLLCARPWPRGLRAA
jgi:2-oxo-4-hydroxy-4-carboxy-5-ureidoimidazoline decarboxylase